MTNESSFFGFGFYWAVMMALSPSLPVGAMDDMDHHITIDDNMNLISVE